MIGKGYCYKDKRISPLQFTMMIMLREKPMYGYELLKKLREEFKGLWTPQTGSIYPSLKKLESHGLVKSETRHGTDYYYLSDEGNTFVSESLAKIPGDIEFMIRYLNILARAASSVRDENPEKHIRAFLNDFEQDVCDPKERLEALRSMREILVSKLASVQAKIEEIEKMMKPKRGESP
ncbi:MAG: PadR family transcriptional regulator [Methanomassiliicoccales archaeon]|jgi:DNA-binding PadR family transcriptional regulator|nr:PadR family transcriptional regulator [Methanomassiliicoccales archaeon]